MKIDKTLQSVTTASLAEGKKRADVNSTGSDLSQVNNVHLSSNATKLQHIDSNLASESVVNPTRIQEIKQAISEGNFQINPGVVADKLLETVRELIQSKKGEV